MKFIKRMFSRVFITGILILIQLVAFFYLIFVAPRWSAYAYALADLLAIVLVLFIISKNQEPTLKISWLLLIVMFPIIGVPTYLIFVEDRIAKKYYKMYSYKKDKEEVDESDALINKISKIDENISSQFKYINNSCGLSVCDGTRVEYLKTGEIFYDKLLLELKKAKKYIFMEYFIIEEGKMWNSILTILKKKVDEGVDVRIIYDDFGCIKKLPYGYAKKLRKLGIKCYKFNNVIPVVSTTHNNRDHRKITVIDGKVGFVSGANLADEYINEKVLYGRWKDCALLLEGKAVDNLVETFLLTYCTITKTDENINLYKDSDYIPVDGYVQVYSCGPKIAYEDYVGEDVYLNMINSANDYLYITTPYLIIDYTIMHALELAAKRGVDVRIITPHIPDKKIIFMMTQQSYEPLLKSGVKIYEYTPGFIHSKVMIIDGKLASLGTVNLDYRSMLHNFECGVCIFNSDAITDMKNDFEETMEISQEKTLDDCKVKCHVSLFRKVLSFFAPLF